MSTPLRRQYLEIKRRYPGYKIYGLRRYQDGRERFLHTGPRPAGLGPTGD